MVACHRRERTAAGTCLSPLAHAADIAARETEFPLALAWQFAADSSFQLRLSDPVERTIGTADHAGFRGFAQWALPCVEPIGPGRIFSSASARSSVRPGSPAKISLRRASALIPARH